VDEMLSSLLTEGVNIERTVVEFDEALKIACSKSFQIHRASSNPPSHRSISWWTAELTILRKRTNALRRLYQRTRNNEELREKRKAEYFESKATYAATIKREKIRSWKVYCDMSMATNPWGAIYKIAAGKRNTRTQFTTLRKRDRILTAHKMISLMMETVAPWDNRGHNDYHKQIRALTEQPANMEDDREFTTEIRNIIGNMKNKAPGEDGITSPIYNHAFQTVPTFITAIYNSCLKQGIFPTEWKKAKIIPIIKPSKERSYEVSKFCTISLLNIGGKVLETLMINRINHHIHTIEYLNKNQYGFRPQTSTIDAIMALKEYAEEGFSSGEVTVLVSLDVEGTFNSAWWPSILKGLKDSGCPRNLQNLMKSYLSKRLAMLQTNNISIEEITRGCPQGSCCGPDLWCIFYNSLLNLNFTHRTKTITFADDLILATRAKTVIETENIMNTELTKVSAWATANKIHFNEQKSKTMLLSRRKRKERKKLDIFLNYRPLSQVGSLRYLGIIIDSKLTFREHINYITERCSKLIFALSKSAKINWGLSYEALKTIYKRAILPLLTYGAPVWSRAIAKKT
jgi:hypothetical protein